MAKLKTRKAITKRFKITKRGKFLHRQIGQSHFNAKQSGKKRRGKRRLKELSKVDVKQIKKMLKF